jgi:hypothetical protein
LAVDVNVCRAAGIRHHTRVLRRPFDSVATGDDSILAGALTDAGQVCVNGRRRDAQGAGLRPAGALDEVDRAGRKRLVLPELDQRRAVESVSLR